MTPLQERPVVSVALCTHNGANHIAEQIGSIVRQTWPVGEIVLSDDASSDDTVAIAEAVVAAAAGPTPELRVLRNSTPLGVVRNFEQSITACEGEFVALSDQDDVWHPEKLELLVAAFHDAPESKLVHSDARLVDAEGLPLGYTLLRALELNDRERAELTSGRSIDALLRRNLVTGATTVIRRDLLAAAVPFPSEWIHDEWLAIIAASISTTRLVPEALIDYRQHGANQIGARKLTPRDRVRKLREPREERNRHLVARAEVLFSHLQSLGASVAPGVLESVTGKLEHERFRLGLPRARIARISPILGAVRSGHYDRFSRGNADVLRDLVQPAS